ncbi:MAG: hypothetical protein GY754_29345 [bacterium]|nr:hypothetical protein [bacterium]
MVRKKLTLEQIQKKAKERGGVCISKRYVNSKLPLKWQCKNGHVWQAPYSYIRQGNWCAECSGKKKLTIKLMREIARERGGKCLSKEYVNNVTKLKWQCKEGHTWESIPRSVKTGRWCPVCGKKEGGEKRKASIKDMQKIAKKNGGKCLSVKYENSLSKLSWQCKKGHVWQAIPKSVTQGNWCSECSGKKKLTIELMRQMAKEHGGKCLSKKYINGNEKLRWQCKEKHEWDAAPRTIRRGTWCPFCANKKKGR